MIQPIFFSVVSFRWGIQVNHSVLFFVDQILCDDQSIARTHLVIGIITNRWFVALGCSVLDNIARHDTRRSHRNAVAVSYTRYCVVVNEKILCLHVHAVCQSIASDSQSCIGNIVSHNVQSNLIHNSHAITIDALCKGQSVLLHVSDRVVVEQHVSCTALCTTTNSSRSANVFERAIDYNNILNVAEQNAIQVRVVNVTIAHQSIVVRI
mmetsp:Transcript_7228/g.11084  ORF Transcript_7228/g.11084 Transcript_7228/m.11084 type:complete len:209 (-) Transcript_7228:316-942(-)